MSQASRLTCIAALLAACAAPVFAVEADWGVRLAEDVGAFHAALADSHPGPVDSGNPGFTGLLDAGLARALARAPDTRDFAGYWWALREFQATFDDGHVQLSTTGDAPALPAQWPGFLTRWNGADYIVTTRLDGADLPPHGARLQACDGIDADALAARTVGRFRGRWQLAAQRVAHGGRLFVDAGNPWLARPVTCSFQVEGVSQRFALNWRDIADDALARHLALTRAVHSPVTGVREAGDGQLWISAASFDADSASPHFDGLSRLLADLDNAARVSQATRIVLDVRGNGGGSSHWNREIARRLWGDVALRALPASESRVDWRVSADNHAAIQAFGAMLRAQDAPDAEMLHWADVIDRGMADALARGEPLWRHPVADESPSMPDTPRPRALRDGVPVFVLTDAACASACLDALDLWLALGAVPVGGETSADTVYMDVREATLPSGLATIAIPMKVYRGRPRGHNQPYRPVHAWHGDFADDAGLAAWIATLPAPDAAAATTSR